MRHAEAAAGTPDHARPLTPAGRDQARALGAQLRDSGVLPDAIVTSPLLRARETGSLLGEVLGIEATADERLAPGALASGVTDAVRGLGGAVIAIGHQPDCSRIAAELTGEPEPSFPPGGSITIHLEP